MSNEPPAASMQSCTCGEYAAIGAQVRRQLLEALDSWAQEVQAAAEDVDCIFGTSSGATSVGCRVSRCPLLVEFALATLKMLLMGGI